MFGKYLGCYVFCICLVEFGFILEDIEVNVFFEKFKDLVDKKKDIIDDDLLVLVI